MVSFHSLPFLLLFNIIFTWLISVIESLMQHDEYATFTQSSKDQIFNYFSTKDEESQKWVPDFGIKCEANTSQSLTESLFDLKREYQWMQPNVFEFSFINEDDEQPMDVEMIDSTEATVLKKDQETSVDMDLDVEMDHNQQDEAQQTEKRVNASKATQTNESIPDIKSFIDSDNKTPRSKRI